MLLTMAVRTYLDRQVAGVKYLPQVIHSKTEATRITSTGKLFSQLMMGQSRGLLISLKGVRCNSKMNRTLWTKSIRCFCIDRCLVISNKSSTTILTKNNNDNNTNSGLPLWTTHLRKFQGDPLFSLRNRKNLNSYKMKKKSSLTILDIKASNITRKLKVLINKKVPGLEVKNNNTKRSISNLQSLNII